MQVALASSKKGLASRSWYGREMRPFWGGEPVLWLAVPLDYGRESRWRSGEGMFVYVLRQKWNGNISTKAPWDRPLPFETCSYYPELLLDWKQFARMMGYNASHAWRFVRDKRVPYLVLNGQRFFLASDVDAWLEEAKKNKEILGPDWKSGNIPKGPWRKRIRLKNDAGSGRRRAHGRKGV